MKKNTPPLYKVFLNILKKTIRALNKELFELYTTFFGKHLPVVMCFVGKSGTGKSYKAFLVAQKYHLNYIIDDGLLIKGKEILAGQSAKKANGYLQAVRIAIYEDLDHRKEVAEKIKEQKNLRILILGTSDRMVEKIVERLDLPSINKIVYIEEFSTPKEIEIATYSRNKGEHVIPIPFMEAKRYNIDIAHNSVKLFLKKGFMLFSDPAYFEKSIVRPNFDKRGNMIIDISILENLTRACIKTHKETVILKNLIITEEQNIYKFNIFVSLQANEDLSDLLESIKLHLIRNLTRYVSINIGEVNIIIDSIRSKRSKRSKK